MRVSSAFFHNPTFPIAARQSSSAIFSTSMISELSDPSAGASTVAAAAEAATTFEPIVPDTEALVGFGIIIVLSVIAAWVWQEQVVPVSRTKLAISKSRGGVKEYLDDLKASEPSNFVNSTSAIDGVDDVKIENSNAIDSNLEGDDGVRPLIIKDDRAFERWLFTDWLLDNKSERKGGRQKEPALPILKNAKWNSGDNPVLVASALLGVCVLFSAITERIVSI